MTSEAALASYSPHALCDDARAAASPRARALTVASTRLFLKGFFSSARAKAGPNRVAPRQSRLRRASSGHAWGLVVGLALGFGSGAAHATLFVNQPWVRYSVSA